jgi:hypothetical protein
MVEIDFNREDTKPHTQRLLLADFVAEVGERAWRQQWRCSWLPCVR